MQRAKIPKEELAEAKQRKNLIPTEPLPTKLSEYVHLPSQPIPASSQHQSLPQPTAAFIPPIPEPHLRIKIIYLKCLSDDPTFYAEYRPKFMNQEQNRMEIVYFGFYYQFSDFFDNY